MWIFIFNIHPLPPGSPAYAQSVNKKGGLKFVSEATVLVGRHWQLKKPHWGCWSAGGPTLSAPQHMHQASRQHGSNIQYNRQASHKLNLQETKGEIRQATSLQHIKAAHWWQRWYKKVTDVTFLQPINSPVLSLPGIFPFRQCHVSMHFLSGKHTLTFLNKAETSNHFQITVQAHAMLAVLHHPWYKRSEWVVGFLFRQQKQFGVTTFHYPHAEGLFKSLLLWYKNDITQYKNNTLKDEQIKTQLTILSASLLNTDLFSTYCLPHTFN